MLDVLLTAALVASTAAEDPNLLLITRDLELRPVHVVEINDEELVHLGAESWHSIDLDDCLGLLRADPTILFASPGIVELADGQRLPGTPGRDEVEDHIAWLHPVIGSLLVPIDRAVSVVFVGGASPPSAGEADVVQMRNGDVTEGLLVGLGSSLSVEIDDGEAYTILDIPLDRVLAVRLVTPRETPTGRRIWLTDTTVLRVDSFDVAESSTLRARGPLTGGDPVTIPLASVNGLHLDPEAMIALASLEPNRVEGPDTRFVLPDPERLEPHAPLDLSPIRLSGPIVVHYSLPRGATRFATTVRLTPGMERFGDCELVVRDDDREVFRTRLSAAQSEAALNVELRGSELTIEIEAGANGPIQDSVDLIRAMIGVE